MEAGTWVFGSGSRRPRLRGHSCVPDEAADAFRTRPPLRSRRNHHRFPDASARAVSSIGRPEKSRFGLVRLINMFRRKLSMFRRKLSIFRRKLNVFRRNLNVFRRKLNVIRRKLDAFFQLTYKKGPSHWRTNQSTQGERASNFTSPDIKKSNLSSKSN